MASEAMRTHRESLAIVLAILGGALWLAMPCILWLHGETQISAPIVAGSGLGAASCALALRNMSRVSAAVGGAVSALVILGVGSIGKHDLNLVTAAAVAFTAAAVAFAAASLVPARLGASHTAVAAALVSSSVIGVLILVAGVLFAHRWAHHNGEIVTVSLLFGAPLAGGAVAALLLPGTTPGALSFGWAILVAGTSVLAGLVMVNGFVTLLAVAGGLGVIVFGGGFGAIGVAMVNNAVERRRPRPDLPSARVVDHGSGSRP